MEIKVAIADDHPMIIKGLKNILLSGWLCSAAWPETTNTRRSAVRHTATGKNR